MGTRILPPITMVSRFTALKYEALNLADESTDLRFRTSLKNSNLVPVSAFPQHAQNQATKVRSCFKWNNCDV